MKRKAGQGATEKHLSILTGYVTIGICYYRRLNLKRLPVFLQTLQNKMRNVIRYGDPISHGGYVVSGQSDTDCWGKPIACVGDSIVCRIHGPGTIIEGDNTWTINGKAVALHGHHGSCGCALISTLPNVGKEDGGGASTKAAKNSGNSGASSNSASSSASNNKSSSSTSDDSAFDLFFHAKDEKTGDSIVNTPYKITLADGSEFEGVTDDSGYTEKVSSDSAITATIEIPYYGNDNSDTNSQHGSNSCRC